MQWQALACCRTTSRVRCRSASSPTRNSADTDGHSLALALRGGGDFKFGQLTTGPVAGLVLQQVHLNGFTETGISGASALSFGSQTRELVCEPAWLARMRWTWATGSRSRKRRLEP